MTVYLPRPDVFLGDWIAFLLMSDIGRAAIVGLAFCCAGCVTEALDTLRTAIRQEAPKQEAVALEMGIHPSRLTRKLHNDGEGMTLANIVAMPVNVQLMWHLLEIVRLGGMPDRVHKWIKVASVVQKAQRSA